MNSNILSSLVGLDEGDLGEIMLNNPRAYMSLRGAVSEKHLEKLLLDEIKTGGVSSFTIPRGGSDKDFVIVKEGTPYTLECKNVEVLKVSKKSLLIGYLRYLRDVEEIPVSVPSSSSDLKKEFSSLPKKYRESGLSRYKYSASRVLHPSVGSTPFSIFVDQFSEEPLSLDFKKTRNSIGDEIKGRASRFYEIEEIDIIAACLFSRTLEWKFVFTKASNLPTHEKYENRYSDKVIIDSSWVESISDLL